MIQQLGRTQALCLRTTLTHARHIGVSSVCKVKKLMNCFSHVSSIQDFYHIVKSDSLNMKHKVLMNQDRSYPRWCQIQCGLSGIGTGVHINPNAVKKLTIQVLKQIQNLCSWFYDLFYFSKSSYPPYLNLHCLVMSVCDHDLELELAKLYQLDVNIGSRLVV